MALDFRQVATSSLTAFAATVVAVVNGNTIDRFRLLVAAVKASAVIDAANSHCYFCCATVEID